MQCARFLLRSFPVGSFQHLANIFHIPANWAFLKIQIVSGAKGVPKGLLSHYDYRALIVILSMCTAQNFFQTFCTRAIEYTLLAMVGNMSVEYVFVLDFWK
jgi:hypothetical protein